MNIAITCRDKPVEYVIAEGGKTLRREFLEALISQPQLDTPPAAFVWRDVFTKFNIDLRRHRYLVNLDHSDARLMKQIDHNGRCAIRADLMDELTKDRTILHRGDTSHALVHLCQQRPGEIVFLEKFCHPVSVKYRLRYQNETYVKAEKHPQLISVVINFRDKAAMLIRCLNSLLKQKLDSGMEIILVNNQSQHATMKALKQHLRQHVAPRYPVEILDYDANFNHSKQCDHATGNAKGDVLCMLNNDAKFLKSNALQRLADEAIVPGVATVGPRFVGRMRRFISLGMQILPTPQGPVIREARTHITKRLTHDSCGNSFACALIPTAVWKELGGLDGDNFPTQYNDADFCLKAMQAGYRHLSIGKVKVYHEPGATRRKADPQAEQLLHHLSSRYPDMLEYVRRQPHYQDFDATRHITTF